MVDFGLSFCCVDIFYFCSSVGGFLFWVVFEVFDLFEVGMIQESEVVVNLYFFDVYLLGMVFVVQMMLDGVIFDSFLKEEFYKVDKWERGCFIFLDYVNSDDMMFIERVFIWLKGLIDRCCEVERIDRIFFQQCFLK